MNDLFEQIYQTYFDPVYRYILSLSADPHIAEEITQETFFKAMQSLDRFRGDCSLKSWLCTIAKNQWFSYQRKQKSRPIEEVSFLADPSIGPDETVSQMDENMRIHKLIHQLNDPYREVFTLRALGQLSFRDIAEIFGKTENWACVVYHRAKAMIRERMEE